MLLPNAQDPFTNQPLNFPPDKYLGDLRPCLAVNADLGKLIQVLHDLSGRSYEDLSAVVLVSLSGHGIKEELFST